MPYRFANTEMKERLKAAEERLQWSEEERKLLLQRLIESMEARAKDQTDENKKLNKKMDEQEKDEHGEVEQRLQQMEKRLEESEHERKDLMERLMYSVKTSSASEERSRSLAEESLWLIEDSMRLCGSATLCCQPQTLGARVRRRHQGDGFHDSIGGWNSHMENGDSRDSQSPLRLRDSSRGGGLGGGIPALRTPGLESSTIRAPREDSGERNRRGGGKKPDLKPDLGFHL